MTTDGVLMESFPARPEVLAGARSRLSNFAAGHGAAGEQLDAIRLVVSEALTNVIVHAYPDDPGKVHVTAALAEGQLWILVADDGQGLKARSARSGLGLGLALIAQLTDEFAIAHRSTGGTELRMRFAVQQEAEDTPDRPSVVSRLDPCNGARGRGRQHA